MTGDGDARGAVIGLLSEVLTEHYGVPPGAIVPEAGIGDLGLDSVDVIEALSILEDRLGVDLEADGALDVELSTFGGMVDAVLAAQKAL